MTKAKTRVLLETPLLDSLDVSDGVVGYKNEEGLM